MGLEIVSLDSLLLDNICQISTFHAQNLSDDMLNIILMKYFNIIIFLFYYN